MIIIYVENGLKKAIQVKDQNFIRNIHKFYIFLRNFILLLKLKFFVLRFEIRKNTIN